MKKYFRALLMIGCCLAALSAAAFAGSWSLSDWLKELQNRVARTEQKQRSKMVAVAAVRGSKESDAPAKKLYWKGKRGAAPVTAEELAEFKSALSLAQTGKQDEAKKSFNDFIANHPGSPLADEAQETLALLSEETKSESAPAPSAAAPAAEAAPKK